MIQWWSTVYFLVWTELGNSEGTSWAPLSIQHPGSKEVILKEWKKIDVAMFGQLVSSLLSFNLNQPWGKLASECKRHLSAQHWPKAFSRRNTGVNLGQEAGTAAKSSFCKVLNEGSEKLRHFGSRFFNLQKILFLFYYLQHNKLKGSEASTAYHKDWKQPGSI